MSFTVYGFEGDFYVTYLTEGAIEMFSLVIPKLCNREMIVDPLVEEYLCAA